MGWRTQGQAAAAAAGDSENDNGGTMLQLQAQRPEAASPALRNGPDPGNVASFDRHCAHAALAGDGHRVPAHQDFAVHYTVVPEADSGVVSVIIAPAPPQAYLSLEEEVVAEARRLKAVAAAEEKAAAAPASGGHKVLRGSSRPALPDHADDVRVGAHAPALFRLSVHLDARVPLSEQVEVAALSSVAKPTSPSVEAQSVSAEVGLGEAQLLVERAAWKRAPAFGEASSSSLPPLQPGAAAPFVLTVERHDEEYRVFIDGVRQLYSDGAQQREAQGSAAGGSDSSDVASVTAATNVHRSKPFDVPPEVWDGPVVVKVATSACPWSAQPAAKATPLTIRLNK